MSKIMTFSRYYPSYHPRAGEPTYFVEKIHYNIWSTIPDKWIDAQSMVNDLNKHLPPDIVFDFIESLEMEVDLNDLSKGHTIRSGWRWKEGDWFSPRVWSGRPYNSKQIIIAPDIQIKRVWDFKMLDGNIFIDYDMYALTSSIEARNEMAGNDGLELEDFEAWFKRNFSGQIICWNENIEY